MRRQQATKAAGLAIGLAMSIGGCGDHDASAASAPVVGRGLQPAWWDRIPDVEVDESQDAEEPIVIPSDALFASGESTIRPDDLDALRAFARDLLSRLDEVPGTWLVVGATDGVGEEDANRALGLRRAQAVIEVLVEEGIPMARLEARSWGESHAVADESGPDPTQAQALNRRVEIIPVER